MLRTFCAAPALAALALTPACAQEPAEGAYDRAGIEQIVREYILDNPEIIEEAIVALSEKQRAEQAEAAAAALSSSTEKVFEDRRDFVLGPQDAPVTVVEFFDYRCPYCKPAAGWVQSLPERHDGKVRVIFKELAILSPESEQAALAAIAAKKQGKYLELHVAMMEARSEFKEADINKFAADVGLDVEQLRKDMADPEARQQIADVRDLAFSLGMNATPFFIVEDKVFRGFDRASMEELIAELVSEG